MKNLSKIFKWYPFLLFMAFFPISMALMQGQDSILLVLLLVVALIALDRGKEWIAGAAVGLGLFKFQIVLPIGFFFLVWRRWRFSAGFAVAAASMAALSLCVVGLGATWYFAKSLLMVGTEIVPADHPALPLAVKLMGNLRGLVAGLAGQHFSPQWVQGITVALSAAVVIWIGLFVRPRQAGSDALILAITASTVVSYYLFIHDLSMMLIPIVLCLDQNITADIQGDIFGSAVAIASIVLYIAPATLFVSSSYVYVAAVPLIALLFLLASHVKRTAVLNPEFGMGT
jgi:hypothetical protein